MDGWITRMRSTTKCWQRRRSTVPSANHVCLGRRGRRHHFKEMDQGDRLLDYVLRTIMSYNLCDLPVCVSGSESETVLSVADVCWLTVIVVCNSTVVSSLLAVFAACHGNSVTQNVFIPDISGADHVGWGSWPLKICRRVTVCFDPP